MITLTDNIDNYKVILAETGNDSILYTGCLTGYVSPGYKGEIFMNKIYSYTNESTNLQIHSIKLSHISNLVVKINSCFWINMISNNTTNATVWALYGIK